MLSCRFPPQMGLIDDDPSVELSSNRTSLSFERTRMGTDRTLMANVRTALSLIAFGFTLHETVRHLSESDAFPAGVTGRLAGLSLLTLGLGVLVIGILGHLRFLGELTSRRNRVVDLGLLHRSLHYSATPTLIAAVLLLMIGLGALGSVAIQIRS